MDDYPDLRQLMASRTQQFVQFPDPFSVRPFNNYNPNSSIAVGQQVNTRGLFEFGSAASAPPSFSTIISDTSVAANLNGSTAGSSVGSLYSGLELMNHQHGWSINGNDGSAGNNSRWPRQETLTLLEIRSSLDSKFKETNQKGPLWDEVSRIMSEEHGYQRSGKKCKEKFENLYKYYKKTKLGKSGRQDGKHYRFFRQLEAIYGDRSTNPLCSTSDQTNLTGTLNPSLLYNHTTAAINQEYQEVKLGGESLSFSNNSTDMETSTSENNGDDLSNSANENQRCSRRVKKTRKAHVEEFVNSQMMKVMKAQEGWMEKMLKTIEGREEERFSKEEEWRKREEERFKQQVDEFWAKERAWVETRDASIMEALGKIRGMGTNSYNNKAKDENTGGLQLMGGGLVPSSSNYMNMESSSLYIPTNEAENLWNRYGGKLSK
ncbi:hypothetical protein ACLB2K_072716 [Fragaria x ananassa]